jgi:hypothetical protein
MYLTLIVILQIPIKAMIEALGDDNTKRFIFTGASVEINYFAKLSRLKFLHKIDWKFQSR